MCEGTNRMHVLDMEWASRSTSVKCPSGTNPHGRLSHSVEVSGNPGAHPFRACVSVDLSRSPESPINSTFKTSSRASNAKGRGSESRADAGQLPSGEVRPLNAP
ncbi:unnamed protein product [Gadus morhua 'NCC']